MAEIVRSFRRHPMRNTLIAAGVATAGVVGAVEASSSADFIPFIGSDEAPAETAVAPEATPLEQAQAGFAEANQRAELSATIADTQRQVAALGLFVEVPAEIQDQVRANWQNNPENSLADSVQEVSDGITWASNEVAAHEAQATADIEALPASLQTYTERYALLNDVDNQTALHDVTEGVQSAAWMNAVAQYQAQTA